MPGPTGVVIILCPQTPRAIESASDPLKRFLQSMVLDFEKWHDGIGYDVSAIAEMTTAQRREVEQTLLTRGVEGWRDLEALDHLDTPAARAAILRARESGDAVLRLAAQNYGPAANASEREAAILEGLETDDLSDGLSKALDQASDYPTPKVIAALFRCARDRPGVAGYQAVAVLFFLHGKIDSVHDMSERPFFLRFAEPASADRRESFSQLCQRLGRSEAEVSGVAWVTECPGTCSRRLRSRCR